MFYRRESPLCRPNVLRLPVALRLLSALRLPVAQFLLVALRLPVAACLPDKIVPGRLCSHLLDAVSGDGLGNRCIHRFLLG